jgi:phosphatidylglycerol:prolipoprotein diacylglycerol transferase
VSGRLSSVPGSLAFERLRERVRNESARERLFPGYRAGCYKGLSWVERFTLHPVLFHLGRFAVTGYAALIGLGMVGGTAVAYLAAQPRGLDPTCTLDASLVAALGGLVGGRVAYVLAHWTYYSDHVKKALRPWDGGLAWPGALAGGLFAVLVYCAVRRMPTALVLDLLAPGAGMLAVCSWLGCFLNGCACGVETYPGQGLMWTLSMELPDLYGIWTPRVAVQLLGAAWGGVALAGTVVAWRRTRVEGILFPLWLILYSSGSFALGALRGDEMPWVAGWRAGQLADLALVLIGVTMLAVRQWLMKREQTSGAA